MGAILGLAFRILASVIAQPGVQDFIAVAGKAAIRRASRAAIEAIENRRSLRKSSPSMK